jgi:parallel beta-helix repeat protein
MHKALYVFLLSATLANVALVMHVDFGSAQIPIEVNGILTQDTVWSKQGSPYIFSGGVGVPQDVTLTIEAGVTVDIGAHYLEVNGTLNVQGTENDPAILMADGNSYGLAIGLIDTVPVLNGHNNIVVAFGNPTCTFEHAILKNTSLFGQGTASSATVNITDCSLVNSAINLWGKTSITNSHLTAAITVRGPSTLTNNTFDRGLVISSGSSACLLSGDFTVFQNTIANPNHTAVETFGTGTISDNVIWGSSYGITQQDKTTMSATIEGNLIKNNTCGIFFRDTSDNSIIRDNTFTQNTVGISNPQYQVTIAGNSFIGNTQYAIQAGSDAVSAKDNYWGTTDRTAIATQIYDSNDDFSLGTIVYQPILTQANINTPNPNMCPLQSTNIPSPTDVVAINYLTGGQTNTSLNNIEIGLTAAVIILSLVIVTLVVRAHRSLRK